MRQGSMLPASDCLLRHQDAGATQEKGKPGFHRALFVELEFRF
jgi:hypothetical protein